MSNDDAQNGTQAVSDKEWEALRVCSAALYALDPSARDRVVGYLFDRFHINLVGE